MKLISLLKLLTYRITSDGFDRRFGNATCYFTAGVVLALGLFTLGRLELSVAQMFVALHLSFATSLIFLVIGLLLQISHPSERDPLHAAHERRSL